VVRYAQTLATFGYLYPRVEAAKGRDRQYSLLTDPTLVWLALAAASGIVGNLAYDVIKGVLLKLRDRKTIPVVALGQTSSDGEIRIGTSVVMSLTLSAKELGRLFAAVQFSIAATKSNKQDLVRLKRCEGQLLDISKRIERAPLNRKAPRRTSTQKRKRR
jgi:hypothetical protein